MEGKRETASPNNPICNETKEGPGLERSACMRLYAEPGICSTLSTCLAACDQEHQVVELAHT
eukprot:3798091-Amphidinium_carterae.1